MSVSQLVHWSFSKHCPWGYYNYSANSNSLNSSAWAAEKKYQHRTKLESNRSGANKPWHCNQVSFLLRLCSDLHLSAPFCIACQAWQHVCWALLYPAEVVHVCTVSQGCVWCMQWGQPMFQLCWGLRGAALQPCRGLRDCIQTQQRQS